MNSKFFTAGILLICILSFPLLSGADDPDITIESLSASPGDTMIDEPFSVKVTLYNDRSRDLDFDLMLYIDDVLVYEVEDTIPQKQEKQFSVNSNSDFKTLWENSNLYLVCGKHTIKAAVTGEDGGYDEGITYIRIADQAGDDDEKFIITDIEPEEAVFNSIVRIFVMDEQDRRDIDVEVILTNTNTSEFAEHSTNNQGVAEFPILSDFEKDKREGKYVVVAGEPGRCADMETLYVKKTIQVLEVTPRYPRVGQEVLVKTDVPFADAKFTGYRFIPAAKADSRGDFYFTSDYSGKYDVEISKSGYWSKKFEVVFSERDALTISIEPENPKVSGTAKISVISDGRLVEDAEVIITYGDRKMIERTCEEGFVEFIPAGGGKYTVQAEKSGYLPAVSDFEILKAMDASVIPENPQAGSDVVCAVKDNSGNPVDGASVYVKFDGNLEDVYSTDREGVVKFTAVKIGKYDITVSKDGFENASIGFSTRGEMSLNIKYTSSQEVIDSAGRLISSEIYDDIEISFQGEVSDVVSKGGVNLSAHITKPDKKTLNLEGRTIKFTPDIAGEYSVTVSSSGFNDMTIRLWVVKRKLEIHADIINNKLAVNVTRKVSDSVQEGGGGAVSAEVIEGVLVTLEGAEGISQVKTGAEGRAEFELMEGKQWITVVKDGYESGKIMVYSQGSGGMTTIFLIFIGLFIIAAIVALITIYGK